MHPIASSLAQQIAWQIRREIRQLQESKRYDFTDVAIRTSLSPELLRNLETSEGMLSQNDSEALLQFHHNEERLRRMDHSIYRPLCECRYHPRPPRRPPRVIDHPRTWRPQLRPPHPILVIRPRCTVVSDS